MSIRGPDIDELRATYSQIADAVCRTPVVRCPAIEAALDNQCRVFAKLELMQVTGTFKARGALATMRQILTSGDCKGVTAVSAGNHAIATAFAAQSVGASAKVVMTASANPARVSKARSYGAEVVVAPDVHAAFAEVERIREEEGRDFVHPFDGLGVALGTGGVGLEICEQIDAFDALLVPVGGGGLIGGIANAVRQLRPKVEIIGIEPHGADSMRRSLASGTPATLARVDTIADSLGAPFAMQYSFDLVQRNVNSIACVSDAELRAAMRFLFAQMKFAVEPACAASTAALLGPLRDHLAGKTVVLVFCGSNIDWQTFASVAELDALD